MESKFVSLRKQLDRHGYRQPFDVNCLQLVERLFNDLIRANYDLGRSRDLIVHQKSYGNSCHPEHSCVSRPEYGPVVKENSELRQQISTIREECDKELKGLKNRLRTVETENDEIRLLNSQHQNKIRQLEKESKRKSDKLQEYQEKSLQTIIQMTGKNGRGHQRMEIENMLSPPSASRITLPAPANPDSRNVDLLRIAEQRIHQLQMDTEAKKTANDEAENVIGKLKQTLREKNEEVQRIQKVLEVMKPYSCTCAHGHAEPLNLACFGPVHSHVNVEYERLQHMNQDLEKKLKEATNTYQEAQAKFANLATRNEQLEKELADVDRVAQALKRQKEELVNTADNEMGDAKKELEKLYEKVVQLENELLEVKREKEQLEREGSKQIVNDGSEQQKLRETNNRLQRENSQLADKLRQVTLKEQELQLKLLQLESGSKEKERSGVDADHIQRIVDSIEKQRDHYKEQLEKVNRSIAGQTIPQLTAEARPYEHLVKLLEDERDLYKKECLKLKNRASSPVLQPSNQLSELERELRIIVSERDELKKVLENLENHIELTDKNLRESIIEKAKLQSELEQAQAAQQPSRNFNDAFNAQKERDAARAELQQISIELQDTRNRLRLATETQITERKRLERRITELETQLLVGNSERAELLIKNSSSKATMGSLEEQIKALQTELTNLKMESERDKSEASQLKVLVEQKENALKEVQRLYSQRVSIRSEAEIMLADLEGRTDELNRIISRQKDEMSTLKKSVATLDRAKDALQGEVDDKAEELANLRQEILSKSNDRNDLRNTISNLEIRIDRLLDDLHDKESEAKGCQRHLDAAKRDIQAVQRLHGDAQIRNRRLEEDLMVMTRDNLALQKDLKKANDDKENITSQIQGYVAEVARVEDLLRKKEKERAELLEQYHNLTSTASDLETQAGNVQLELLSKETELNHTRDAIDGLNQEIEEYFARQQLQDNQILDLRRNLTDAEARLFTTNQEKDQLQRDVTAMRELCARLESSRDRLVEEMSGKESEAEKLGMLNVELRQEVDRLRSRLLSERSTASSLEDLLARNRHKEFHTELSNRELATDVAGLKERLTVVESKLEEQTRIALRYRTQVSELEFELEQLKRQLTNERFERERLHQELKRFKPLSPVAHAVSDPRLSSPSPPLGTISRRPELPLNPANSEIDRTSVEYRRVLTSRSTMDVVTRYSSPPLRNTEPEQVADLSGAHLPTTSTTNDLQQGAKRDGRSLEHENDKACM